MKCTAWMKLLSLKSQLRLGVWNVRTMYEQGRCTQIVNEMKSRGRPKQLWRRTVTKDLENIGRTWGETKLIANNKTQ